jgi:ABC-type uncharacterized transport system substrate-binding protein
MEMNRTIFLYILFAMVVTLSAHPHLFIDVSLKFVFDEQGLNRLEHSWTFDEMFSLILTEDYDLNKNGKFDPNEMEKMKNEAFANLKNSGYFTVILKGAEVLKDKQVSNFRPEIKGSRVVYHFDMPINIPAQSDYTNLLFSIYDPGMYANIPLLEKGHYKVQSNPNILDEHFIDDVSTLSLFINRKKETNGLFMRFKRK